MAHTLRLSVASLCFLVALWQSIALIGETKDREVYAYELAELQHAKYGLLNPNEWVKIGSKIVAKKIDEFELTPEKSAQLKVVLKHGIRETKSYILQNFDPILDRIFGALGQMMGQDDIMIRNARLVWDNSEYPQKLRQWIQGSIDEEKIDEIAEQLLRELRGQLDKPNTRESIKRVIMAELESLEKSTATLVNQDQVNGIMKAHQCTDRLECQNIVREALNQVNARTDVRGALILGLCALIILILVFNKRRGEKPVLSLLIATCTLLWLGGIFTPMLQVEAKIARLDLMVAGESVVMMDQMLFYQSKSVIDFVLLLVETGQIQLVVVGLLVGLFSVVFPLLKLVSSLLYLHGDERRKSNGFLRFFALKSGKWSMADVMVVALFMAYIGFHRMVHTQINQIGADNPKVDVLGTDGTQLLVGFFLFLGFCIASLIVSTVIESTAQSTESETKGSIPPSPSPTSSFSANPK